jgi:hypothetical protein
MARGKEALDAARRRYEAAMEHIDRLTDDLANEKLRRKEAELRAARFEGLDHMTKVVELRNDQLLGDAITKIHQWRTVALADRKRRLKAIQEVWDRLVPDLEIKLHRLTPIDQMQFMVVRYPALMTALMASRSEGTNGRFIDPANPYATAERKLNNDQLRRFQRIMGERGILEANPDIDAGQAWADLMEARQAGFTADEMAEYANLEGLLDESDTAEPTPDD